MESAYSGDGKFIFFSYSHDDQEMLEPFFNVLAKKYNVWHDKDINYGGDWENIIKDHVKRSSLFMFLITPGSLSSNYCKKEIRWSIENDIPFLGIVVNKIDVPEDFKEKQMCNLYEFFSFEKAVDEIARRNSAINITLREEYLNKQKKKSSSDDYNQALVGILNRKKFHGPRSIGSFEDFVKVMNNDFNILDDLEFSTPTLPEEIYNRCSLQIGINSKFHYLFGVCLYLGIGIEINIREAALAFYSAIMENRALPKNMFNNAVWALLKIARDLGIRNINYDLFNKITLGKCDYYYSQISRLKAGYPEKDFAKLADDIANNQNIKSIDKNILLARFFHVMFLGGREYSKDMPFDDRAAYHYDLAIEEGSEFALVCKEELFGDIAHEMKFRMLRGYSFAYNRYSSWLKGKDKFDLSDEEQYNFCLNSARLGNEVAIRDFYEWFYGKKSGEAFFSSLMNFLFEQGFKRGCRGLIQLQEQILLENKSDLKKLYKTKHKELAKKDKELAELSDYVDYLLTKIVEQYSQDKD